MGRKDWYYVHLPKLLMKRLDQFLQTPRAKSMGMSNKPELLRHLINEFLDEEESLYDKMDYVSDIILETEDRDHVVFTYNNESQFKEIVNASVRRGIDRNQINILLMCNIIIRYWFCNEMPFIKFRMYFSLVLFVLPELANSCQKTNLHGVVFLF